MVPIPFFESCRKDQCMFLLILGWQPLFHNDILHITIPVQGETSLVVITELFRRFQFVGRFGLVVED